MIFNEATYYALFLAPSVLAFHLARPTLRPWIITTFGLLFFLYYANIHFGGFWGSACVFIFVWEVLVSRLYRPGSRWCLLGILQAVGFLVAFKYTGFITQVVNDFGGPLGWPLVPEIQRTALPLGLSFFTFEFIHFAVESYRGTVSRPRAATYASFIFFFPTMVAGPIKRIHEYLHQLQIARLTQPLFIMGVTRILVGLGKKHILADTASLWSDRLNTDAALTASPLELAGWVLAYGIKIYFDFSGYSDIALGSANLFGMRFTENFNWPYLSASIAEFWRRWHISLGRFIFDYVYLPLGGSRRGPWRNAFNLVLAFGVSGLWHGAAYNFIVWGVWHGLLGALQRAWQSIAAPRGWVMPRWLAIPATFVAVHVGWAFFAMDLSRAVFVLRRVFLWGAG